MFESVFNLLSTIGIFVFAISGGIVAIRKEMDIIGIVFVAFLPAIGGGTLRDICLDVPVFWLESDRALWVSLAGGLAAYFFYPIWTKSRPLVWADAVGLSMFAPLGAAKAMQLGHGFFVVVLMGVLTAIAGGLLRDIICNEKNLLMREDIYATAAIVGSAVLFLCVTLGLPQNISLLIAALTTFIIRGSGIVFKYKMPKYKERAAKNK